MRLTLPGIDCSAWPTLDETDLEARIAAVGTWYHTIALQGIETPGCYDMRDHVEHYHLPDLRGLEVIDVGASNGFFSFLFESLGAQVTAIDLPSYRDHDCPAWILERELTKRSAAEWSAIDWNELHGGFLVARHALGSRVERILASVYSLPDVLRPRFDVAFCSNVLGHLRDPVAALEAIRAVVKPGGRVIVATPVLQGDFGGAKPANFVGFVDGQAWYVPAERTLCSWLETAGFHDPTPVGRFDLHGARGDSRPEHIGVAHATPARPHF